MYFQLDEWSNQRTRAGAPWRSHWSSEPTGICSRPTWDIYCLGGEVAQGEGVPILSVAVSGGAYLSVTQSPQALQNPHRIFLIVQHLGVVNSPRCSPGGRQPRPASVLVGLVPRPAPPTPSLLPPGGGSSEGTSGSEQSRSVSGPPTFPSPPRRPSSGVSGFMVSA